MIDINCRKDGCMNFVTCDEDVIAVTCSECCVELGVNNNIAFGGQYGEFSNSDCMVWKHGSDLYSSYSGVLYD